MVYREAWGVFLESHTIPTTCLEMFKHAQNNASSVEAQTSVEDCSTSLQRFLRCGARSSRLLGSRAKPRRDGLHVQR